MVGREPMRTGVLDCLVASTSYIKLSFKCLINDVLVSDTLVFPEIDAELHGWLGGDCVDVM